MGVGGFGPRRQAVFWLIATVGCAVAIWTGAADMIRLGHETASTVIRIAFGMVGATICIIFLVLALKAVAVLRRAKAGHGMIARWTVSADDLDTFRENDRARGKAGLRNVLRYPRKSPKDGLEIVFLDDHAIVGNKVFGLVTTGMQRFTGIQVLPQNPLAIEFDLMLTTLVTGSTSFHVVRNAQVLRIPVGRLARAEAVKVLNHFRSVGARETIVNPNFYGRRIRFGWWWLVASVGCAVAGFAMNRPNMTPDEVILPLSLAVGGSVSAIGAAILVLICWQLRRDQFRDSGGVRG